MDIGPHKYKKERSGPLCPQTLKEKKEHQDDDDYKCVDYKFNIKDLLED